MLKLKEYTPREIFGMTIAFVVTVVFVTFLCVLTYGMAKQFNLI